MCIRDRVKSKGFTGVCARPVLSRQLLRWDLFSFDPHPIENWILVPNLDFGIIFFLACANCFPCSLNVTVDLLKTVSVVLVGLLSIAISYVSENPVSESGSDLFPCKIDIIGKSDLSINTSHHVFFKSIEDIDIVVSINFSLNSSQFTFDPVSSSSFS